MFFKKRHFYAAFLFLKHSQYSIFEKNLAVFHI